MEVIPAIFPIETRMGVENLHQRPKTRARPSEGWMSKATRLWNCVRQGHRQCNDFLVSLQIHTHPLRAL